jgi:ABC-type multidrug transport system fused ATPase/permease subunit
MNLFSIGIVGRTGAGKSTITLALFRLLTWQTGTILIDGLDTTTVPLATLRSRMSIIPQDPILFKDTVRGNLDPNGDWPDSKLWQLLERVDLKKVIAELPQQLSYEVADGGANFSLGQRQLLCMARAIVRKSKIVRFFPLSLVAMRYAAMAMLTRLSFLAVSLSPPQILMDEATASLDFTTDQMIRGMIDTEFHDCTVITIAHRLGSVLDADRILVMNKGQVAEFDTPSNLLANPAGFLSQLVRDTNAVTQYHH